MRRLLAGVLLLAVPAIAAAQTSAGKIDEVRKAARIHAGPFYLTPTLQLKELGVDSNVFNAAGEQKSDFTFTVTPKADAWVPVARRALLHAAMATDLVWYAEYSTERSVDPQFTTRAEAYFNRFTFFAGAAYLNTRQRPNFEIDLRSRHLERNLLGGVDVRLTTRFSMDVAARRDDTEYDADARIDGTNLQRTLNRTTTGGQASARYRLTPLTTIAVRYDNLVDRFEFSPARDSRSYRIMPGVEFNPRALIKGRAYVGHRKFTPDAAEVLPEFSGLVAELDLSYTLLGATSFGVRYRRDLTYSYEEAQPFFVDNVVGVSVRRALGRRFDVLASTDRHRYAYEDILSDLLPRTPERVDITWNYAASLGYRLGRDGRIGFGASYWKRESTTKRFRDYDNLRIGTTATYGF